MVCLCLCKSVLIYKCFNVSVFASISTHPYMQGHVFSHLQSLQLKHLIFVHNSELLLKEMTLHNSLKVPAPEHAVCIHSNFYLTCRVTGHM